MQQAIKRICIIISLLFIGIHTHAQTAQEMDAHIAACLQQIQDVHNDTAYLSDSIANINERLADYMLQILTTKIALSAPFTEAQKAELDVFTSDDKKVRFYSWDTWTGGTMHVFTDLAQYASGNTIKATDLADTSSEGDPGCFYSDITTINTKDNKTAYLVSYEVVGSNRDKGSGIAAYMIADGKLKRMPIFKAGTKMLSDISYSYDFFANNYSSTEYFPAIHFNKDKSKLYVPVVKKDGSFTEGYLVYVFNGYQFVFDKDAK